MFCSRCGTQLAAGSGFCSKCGAPVGSSDSAGQPTLVTAPGRAAPTALTRPTIVTVLAVLQFIAAAFWVCTAMVMIVAGATAAGDPPSGVPVVLVGVCVLIVGALQLSCGVGLWKLRPFGRILQIIFACVGLLGFPIGTLIAVLILVYLNKPELKLLFSGRAASDMSPQELALTASGSTSGVLIVVFVVVGLVVMIGVAGIVAAIAVPGLLRARMAGNEASAMASIRTVQTAEAVASSASGRFVDMACLLDPQRCAPPPSAAYLDPSFAQSLRAGYRFELFAGPGGASFAYVATPQTFGTSGARSFCGDSAGAVCAVSEPDMRLDGALCPRECVIVR